MATILRTAASHQDYRDIWYYIALDNVDAATRLLRSFDAALDVLAAHPAAGHRRLYIARKLRSFPVGEYIVYYRPIPDGIELLRVLHGSRQVRRRMFRP